MNDQKRPGRGAIMLFFLLVALVALGNGLSDSIYSNYYKDVYNINEVQRGFIEFPRELPGFLCAILIAFLGSRIGDLRTALVAQVLAFAGLMVLGITTPSFNVMLIFLFINSTGMHMFMPLRESIGMSLAEPGQVGKRVGQYSSIQAFVGMAAGLLVFFGFRSGVFTFKSDIKWVFVCGAAAFLLAIIVAFLLVKKSGGGKAEKRPFKLVFRKHYKYYYMLTVLNGVQKQIAYVYGSWVVISLLNKGADTMSMLLIIASFVSIFFMNLLGRWIDRFGIKKMMYIDALTFIVIYVMYGFVVWGIASGKLPSDSWPVLVVYGIFVLDRLSMQIGVVRSIYMRSISISESDIVKTLSTGTSLDHIVSITAASLCGIVWNAWGAQWVFFIAAAFSLGNLFVAWRVRPDEEAARAAELRKTA